jgi:hypothetical protein
MAVSPSILSPQLRAQLFNPRTIMMRLSALIRGLDADTCQRLEMLLTTKVDSDGRTLHGWISSCGGARMATSTRASAVMRWLGRSSSIA